MLRTIASAAAFVLVAAVASDGAAQSSSDLPPGVYRGGQVLADARAGTYTIDPDHTAVLARVQHIGYSWLVFRFDKASGRLGWDPAAPEKSTLSVTVQTSSIATPVKDFAAQLAGDDYLKSGKFPEATFVSTAFHRIDATHGKVDGQFTPDGQDPAGDVRCRAGRRRKGLGRQAASGRSCSSAHQCRRTSASRRLFGNAIEIAVDTEFERAP